MTPDAKVRTAFYVYIALTIIAFGVSFATYDQLPDKMATHWGSDGRPNGYSPKIIGAFVTPVALLFLGALFTAIPRLNVLPEHRDKFAEAFDPFAVTFLCFLFILHLFIIGWSLGYKVDLDWLMPALLGGLFFSVGQMLTKLDPAWSPPKEGTWQPFSLGKAKRVQQNMGQIFRLSGALIFASIALPNKELFIYLAVGTVFVIVTYIVTEMIKGSEE